MMISLLYLVSKAIYARDATILQVTVSVSSIKIEIIDQQVLAYPLTFLQTDVSGAKNRLRETNFNATNFLIYFQ